MTEFKDEEDYEDLIKRLIDLKVYLEKRLKDLEDEVERIKIFYETINEAILSKSFRKAENIPLGRSLKLKEDEVKEIDIKTSSGVLLAKMYVDEVKIEVLLENEIEFSKDVPPFQAFLIKKIFDPIKIKDEESKKRGEFYEENFSYQIIEDDKIINKIIIRNYGSEKRLGEIKTAIRWTFEKMYERKKK